MYATPLQIALLVIAPAADPAGAVALPPEVHAIRPFVCRVYVADGRLSSGVLCHGEVPWVLCASHCLGATGSRVRCEFGGKSYSGTVEARRRDEGAVIRLDRRPPGLAGLPITDREARPGEVLYAAGFGEPGDGYFVHRGEVVGFIGTPTSGPIADCSLEMRGCARQGDSGGPVVAVRPGWTLNGKPTALLLGVIWGTSGPDQNPRSPHHRIAATRLRVTRSLFNLETKNATNNYSRANSRADARGAVPRLVPGTSGTRPGWYPGAS